MRRSPARPGPDRRAAERHGQRGEALAALFLQAKLYRLLARRFRTPVGEIDIVAERGGVLVFVEVKARGHKTSEAAALGAVNQARIARAARYWLARHPADAGRDCRFDVIFLAPGRWPRHLINAFQAP